MRPRADGPLAALVEQPALRAGDKATAEGPAAKTKKKCADSLLEKLENYEESKRRLEKMATSDVEVGEKCEVYSEVRFLTEILDDFRRFVDEIWRF